MRHVPFRQSLSIAITLAVFALALPSAAAEAFSPGQVPARAEGVVHLDLTGLQKTRLWREIDAKASLSTELEAELEKALGDELGDDVGAKLGEVALSILSGTRSATLWIDAREKGALIIDVPGAERLAEAAAGIYQATSHEHRGVTVHRNDEESFLAATGDRLILGDDKEPVHTTIDALHGKGRTLAQAHGKALLRRGKGVVFIAGFGGEILDAIKKSASAKVLQSELRSIVVRAGEREGTLFLTAEARTDSNATAAKLSAAANGIVALLALADDEPELQELLGGVEVEADGDRVRGRIEISVDEVIEVIEDNASGF